MHPPQLKPLMMDLYLNGVGLARTAGLQPAAVAQRQRDNLLPDPDVYIGPTPGWSAERAAAYQACCARQARTPDPLPGWWTVEPRFLLNTAEVASMLGLKPVSVNIYRYRDNGFVRPAAQLGSDVWGWEFDDVFAFGVANGYLDDQGLIRPRIPGQRRRWHHT